MTAYWVIYVSSELAYEMSKINLYEYNSVDKRGDPSILNQHQYLDLITGPIRMHVSDDNTKLYNEVLDWQVTQQAKSI
jgi:hypothetical protein